MMNLKKIAVGIAAIFFFDLPALALDLDEARKLALAGDIDRIEEQFRLHQEDYDSGRIKAEAFKEPYEAFNSTHPKVYQTTQQWLDTYPTSASALVARGGQIVYRADLIRDPHPPGTLPEGALAKVVALAEQSIPMLDAALTTNTNHLAAAHSLNLIGAITQRPVVRLRALEVIKKHDDPDRALLAEIRFVDLSWRVEPGAAHSFCSNRVEAAPNINLRQCIAAVELEQGNLQLPDAKKARAILLTAPRVLFPLAHVFEKYYTEPEATLTFMKSMGGCRGVSQKGLPTVLNRRWFWKTWCCPS